MDPVVRRPFVVFLTCYLQVAAVVSEGFGEFRCSGGGTVLWITAFMSYLPAFGCRCSFAR